MTSLDNELEREEMSDEDRDSQIALIAKHMDPILRSIGFDLDNDPSVYDTPKRFAKYLLEFSQPIDRSKVLGTPFVIEHDPQMVVQSNIPFRMICEHHLLPATGRAHLGYIPSKHVIGLSKLTRLVQAVGTCKPSLQEVIANTIVHTLDDFLKPQGVMVVIKAQHGCMACRGVNAPDVDTISSAVTGLFLKAPHTKEEFFNLVRLQGQR